MKNIIVNTSATRTSGALSIYRQFISHLPQYIGGHRYYIFVDSSMNQPPIDGVTYIRDDEHSLFHRLWWDYAGLKRWLKKCGITPDAVVSLQNTGVSVPCRQIIYYHQPLPFYDRKWRIWKSAERVMYLYKHFYPYFVKRTLTPETQVVVQIPFIKRAFAERYAFPAERISILFPDVETIDVERIVSYLANASHIHFIYPATAAPYKEHRTLVEAVMILREKHPQLVKRIRIHLTLQPFDAPVLYRRIGKYGLQKQFVFDGTMPHDRLLSLYKAAQGLLFPSTIETLGLPLLEAAAFGLPVLVSDLDYAHDVLGDYAGARYVGSYDFGGWATAMEQVCTDKPRYQPMPPRTSSWREFFKLIDK